jgi:hypothetical protein
MRKVRHGAPVFDYTEVARKEHEAVKALVKKTDREHMEAVIERRLSMSFPDVINTLQSDVLVHSATKMAKLIEEDLTRLYQQRQSTWIDEVRERPWGPTREQAFAITYELNRLRKADATIQVGSEDTIMESFRLPQFSYFGC